MFYDKLKLLMQEHNLTAAQLSRDIGISQTILSQWKHGRQTPSADALARLAVYFDAPVEYFLEVGLFAKQDIIEQHIDEIIAPFKEISLEEFPEPFKSVMKGFVSLIDSQPIYKQIEFLQIFFKDINYDETTKQMSYIQ